MLLHCRGRYWHLVPSVGQDAELPQGVGQSGTINGPSPNARGIPGKKPLVPQECETMDCLSHGLLAQCWLRQWPQEQALHDLAPASFLPSDSWASWSSHTTEEFKVSPEGTSPSLINL